MEDKILTNLLNNIIKYYIEEDPDFFNVDNWEFEVTNYENYSYPSSKHIGAAFYNPKLGKTINFDAVVIPLALMLYEKVTDIAGTSATFSLRDSHIDILEGLIPVVKEYKKNTACSGPLKLKIHNEEKLELQCERIKFEMEK